MDKTNRYVTATEYEVTSKVKNTTVTALVDSNNKIWCVASLISGWDKTRYPQDDDFSSLLEEVFSIMVAEEPETFKDLLERIKDSEPEYYKKGMQMFETN